MDTQALLNVIVAVLLGCVGWWLNNLWTMVKSLQEQLSAVHVKLVENYAPRSELTGVFNRIFEKLDEIQKGIPK